MKPKSVKYADDVRNVILWIHKAYAEADAHEVKRWGNHVGPKWGTPFAAIKHGTGLESRRLTAVFGQMRAHGFIRETYSVETEGSRRVGVAGGGAGNFHARHQTIYYSEHFYRETPKGLAWAIDTSTPTRSNPLNANEEKLIRKANVYAMDLECDGIKLPKRIEQLVNLKRALTIAEEREMIQWFHNTAPGNF